MNIPYSELLQVCDKAAAAAGGEAGTDAGSDGLLALPELCKFSVNCKHDEKYRSK